MWSSVACNGWGWPTHPVIASQPALSGMLEAIARAISHTPVQYPDRGIGGSHFDVLGHQRLCDRMCSVNCSKLEDDFADVMIDGFDTDHEFDGNLLVDFTQGEASQYLYLARCQTETLVPCIQVFGDFIA